MNIKFYTELILLIVLGVATSLSLPPLNYFLINFFTFTLLFLFIIKKSKKNKNNKFFFVYGWLFGFGYFFSNLYWISISLTFDESFKYLIPLTIFLIPSFLAIFYGLIFYFFIIFKPKKIISSFLYFSLLFGILEFLRGNILTGFPWNFVAYGFSNQLEILSMLSIIGTYSFNLFCISLFISPALFILKESKKDILVSIFFFVVIIIFYFYGSYQKIRFNNVDKITFDYKLRIIGSNINLDRFYSNIDPTLVIEDLIKLSEPNLNEKTIFVWPEGILPGISQEKLIEYKSIFDKNFNKNHFLIMGINNNNDHSKKYFNSLSIYDNDLNLLSFYNKIKLVPFGEFLPLENIFKKIGLKSITNNYQSFSSGRTRDIMEINEKNFSLKFLPLICYEIIYSGNLFDNYNFDLIINISEDGWFGQSFGPEQHFIHSVFRSIESGKYVLRSSNNGIAGIVNPLGEVEQKINFGKSGYIDFKNIRKIQPTIFSLYGNKIFGLLILLYIFLIFSFNRIKNE